MDYKGRIKDIFSYLLSIKNLNEKIIRNAYEYEKMYFEYDILSMDGCTVNRNPDVEWWLEVNKKSKQLYDQFFKTYLEMEKNGQDIEIIWGHGLIVWKINDQKIIHPVITTRQKLEFNAKDKRFRLTPSSKTSLETGIFEGLDLVNLHSVIQMESEINSTNLDPRNMSDIKDILHELVFYLNSNGKVDLGKSSIEKIRISNCPVIYDIPVIIIRKNTMRLWQREIINVINEIDNGYPIPETVKALVYDKKLDQSKKDLDDWKDVSKDLLFPLSSNYEQNQIVKRLCENYGVVVQGPPGTGKSHTIVNLICHLLAHGKRILVTSQTDRALKVLVNKIPDDIKPLCINVLGNDSNSMKELNDSVRNITDNLSIEPDKLRNDIKDLKEELGKCTEKQSALYERLKELERAENKNIQIENQNYRIMDVSKWVRNNKDKLGVIEDDIKYSKLLPISEKRFNELVLLMNDISRNDKEEYDGIKIMLDKLPDINTICDKMKKLDELNDNLKEYRRALRDWRIPDKYKIDYSSIMDILRESEDKMSKMENGDMKHIMKLHYESKISHDKFLDLVFKFNNYMATLGKLKHKLSNNRVEIPNDIDVKKIGDDSNNVYDYLNSRGKPGRIFKMMHPDLNYIFEDCKVNFKKIENIEQLSILRIFIKEQHVMKEIEILWNDFAKDYNLEVIDCSKDKMSIVKLEQKIKEFNDIVDWDMRYKNRIIALFGRISIPQNLDWHKKQTYSYLIESMECIKKIEDYNELKSYMEILKKIIISTKKMDNLYKAIDNYDIDEVKRLFRRIEYLKSIKGKVGILEEIFKDLKKECPITLSKLLKNWKIKARNFDELNEEWKWAKCNCLIKNIYKINPEFIESEIEEQKQKEKLIVNELVAKKTWYNQILKTTESEKRSLFAWMQAVKRIGKGTGKMVSQYRNIAQNEMEKCKDIIPVWIMPLNRVIENIRLSRRLFDVIIFDESSQSDIFSICGLMRAKKAIIVGDDKQISPETVGIDQTVIQGLISKYLKDIPQSEWFDLQTSLYDTALRVFPNRLILKEHFRSVPEIIGFSNQLCYSREIKPLRYPNQYEAFEQPIVTVKVNGYRDENKPINIKEAEAISNKIAECCNDSKYNGMTMGVISLLGDVQSDVIENLVKQKIGEEEMINRRLICGDAYSFQGDERDVMFLSMVISDNVKFAPLTRESDMRRFNVASSRARDQMWLFYSVDLNNLNKSCVRYNFLNYCLNYKKINKTSQKVEYIFQSKFQKDVYNMLIDEGYFITPQVQVGEYKIDLVVEDEKSRMAIICDGDAAGDGLDWRSSIERQLNLERLGWKFCRIRGTEFYYNPQKAIDKICKKLKFAQIRKSPNSKIISKDLKVV
ncbi:hypothetical protein D4Z93_00625 [Clostridium fermenticellae]|uniref:DUF559 domain-containing protein n=1 Tax=Clostridium fermenticellae TaxID=2068654 RepID=A0A386H0G8_9CLOT|nr:AAA domain-containing protein [Clostridium fermenticellae]AYD39144.1 hypothetical protein D4Z93_00625 [Clostridium fermenticellae]